MDDNTT
jgi:proline iminopeptidase